MFGNAPEKSTAMKTFLLLALSVSFGLNELSAQLIRYFPGKHHPKPQPYVFVHVQAPPVHCAPQYVPVPVAPDDVSFSYMLHSIASQSFESNRLQVAQQIAMSNRLRSDQIAAIIGRFSFESTRLEFAKFAYSRVIDPYNYFVVNNAFRFSSSVDELHRFIMRG